MNSLARGVGKSAVVAKEPIAFAENVVHYENRGIGDLRGFPVLIFPIKYDLIPDKDLDIYSPSFYSGGKCVKMICGCGKLLSKMPHNHSTRLKGHQRAGILGGHS